MLTFFAKRWIAVLGVCWLISPPGIARPADAPLRPSLPSPARREEMIPRRPVRAVTRQEIFQAIQNHFAQKGIVPRDGLKPMDLKIQSALPVFEPDMGLQVKQIDYDPLRRELVFKMWASRQPRYLPFAVTSRRDPQGLGLASLLGRQGQGTASANPPTDKGNHTASSKLPILARPGSAAVLVMQGPSMRITMAVVPLQSGTKGQRILVRDPITWRVMAAQVVGEGLLQASL